jgi:hypothetical protein
MFDTRRFLWLIVVVCGVSVSPQVSAQALFAEPSDEAISYSYVRDTHPDLLYSGLHPLWVDSQGREYTVENNALWCGPVEDGRSNRTLFFNLDPPTHLSPPRSTLYGPMTNRDDVYVLYVGSGGNFEIRQASCREGQPPTGGSLISEGQTDLLANTGGVQGFNRFVPTRSSPQGDLCIWKEQGLVCGNLWASSLLDTWEIRLTADELEAALATPQMHARMRPWIGRTHWYEVPPRWSVAAVAWAPDGTLFAVVSRQHYAWEDPANVGGGAQSHHGLTHRFAIELSPDGQIKSRMGPLLAGWSGTGMSESYWTPLTMGAEVVQYDPDLHAFMWPVSGFDYGEEHFESTQRDNPQIWGRFAGVGLAVFPVGEDTSGYVSLTAHAARAFHCLDEPEVECGQQKIWLWGADFVPGANGALFHLLNDQQAAHAISDSTSMHEVTLGDLDKLDVDADGLTGEQERMLGTSPWLHDSDGGASDDGLEVVVGTAPNDPSDDRARRNHDPLNWMYMESPLLQLAYSEPFTGTSQKWAINISGRGPLCTDGRCYAPDGEVVAEYGQQGTGRAGITASGDTIVVPVGDALHVHHLPSGDEHTIDLSGGSDELADIERVYPIDEDRMWLVGQDKLGYWTSAEGLEIVYDQQQARCDSGLGDCRSGALAPATAQLHDVASWFEPLGYHFGLERFVISVRGRWQFYVVGVHATEPPVVLDNYRSLAEFGPPFLAHPEGLDRPPIQLPVSFLLPAQKGHYVSYNGIFGAHYDTQTMGLSANARTFEHAHSVWGGRIIAPSPVSDHIVEFVPYQVGVEPGDSLFLRGYSDESPNPFGRPFDVETVRRYGLQLYRIGPRGGLIPLWWSPKKGLGEPGGMDVSTDGRLCTVFPEEGLFVEWTAGPNSNNVPLFEAFRGEISNPVDCQYGRQGEVYILGKSPTRVEVWDRATLETRDVTSELGISPSGDPVDLLLDPDGQIEVLIDGPVVAKAYMPDGRAVTMRAEGSWASVWVDDEQITYAPLPNPSITGASGATRRTHGVIVPRPDNKVFISPWGRSSETGLIQHTRLVVVDLATGTAVLAAHQRQPSGNIGPQPAAAAVPGGQGLDPWTLDEYQLPGPDEPADAGDAGQPDAGTPDVGPSIDATLAPQASPPYGGQARFGDDESCSAASPARPAPVAGLVVLTLGLLWLRRSRASRLLSSLLLAWSLAGCGDELGDQGDCPEGAIAMQRTHDDGTFEEWCERGGTVTGPYGHWSADRMEFIVLGQFRDNAAQGRWNFRHPGTSVPWLLGGYVDGHAHGEWEEFDEQGHKIATRHYSYGQPCGRWTEYVDGGVVAEADFGSCS